MIEAQAQIRAREQDRQLREEAELLRTCQRIKAEQAFVGDVARFLDSRAHAVRVRNETLHKDWRRTVFDEVQRQVQRGLDAQTTQEIQRRRTGFMAAYLRDVARKANSGGVVLSDEEHAGPGSTMAQARAHAVKVYMGAVQRADPTQRELEAIREDERRFAALSLGSRSPGSPVLQNAGAAIPFDAVRPRPMLDVTQWHQVRDTQHGRYSYGYTDEDNQDPKWGAGAGPKPRRPRAPLPADHPCFASHVPMDHFTPAAELAAQDPLTQLEAKKRVLRQQRAQERAAGSELRASVPLQDRDTSRVVTHDTARLLPEEVDALATKRPPRAHAGNGGVSTVF